jgi:Arc/MetJ-type ribon-helix-helix transcriptional regulator
MSVSVKYVTVSIPKAVADNIDFLIGELGFWPSRSSFVREASLEKIRRELLRMSESGELNLVRNSSVARGVRAELGSKRVREEG